jgi:hypothetical protein
MQIEDIPCPTVAPRALQPNAPVGLVRPARGESGERRATRHVAELQPAQLPAALGVRVLRVAGDALGLDECLQNAASIVMGPSVLSFPGIGGLRKVNVREQHQNRRATAAARGTRRQSARFADVVVARDGAVVHLAKLRVTELHSTRLPRCSKWSS